MELQFFFFFFFKRNFSLKKKNEKRVELKRYHLHKGEKQNKKMKKLRTPSKLNINPEEKTNKWLDHKIYAREIQSPSQSGIKKKYITRFNDPQPLAFFQSDCKCSSCKELAITSSG